MLFRSFLLLGPAAAFLKINPSFAATFYWPVLVLAVFGAAQRAVGMLRPQWTWYPAAAQLLATAIGLVFINFIINFAGQTPGGGWHPYVVLADAITPTLQLKKMEAIVNASLLMAMAAAWFGMCIAAIIQTWQLLRQIRKGSAQTANPAVLHLL